MADLFGSGNSNQALHVLKKGSQLLKYGRKGNPKLYSFKLSPDESSLTWLSSGKEKTLKLASVSRIVSGQRTAVFQKNLHPEKVHVSFSLIYNNGKRSLDLICKDKTEAEVWFVGLRALLDSGHSGRSKIDGWNDGGISFDDTKDLTSNRLSDNSIYSTEISSPESSLITSNLSSCSLDKSATLDKSDAPSMYAKGSSSDVFRVSISSAPSTSSHGSVQDDLDNLGDVYVWGEVICDNATRVGNDKYDTPFPCRTDILLPRPLECNIVFDVRYVACGVRHSALVTRQGEVFTWGEESGGRLGHGVGEDIVQPRLVESLTVTNTDFVACGEFHTCVVTTSGELYTWGDGTHNAGLLGHGSHVSHWIPKRVSGPLDGVQVSYVACGTWHTALITYSGQLFTFGDGTFGVLGHGNRESYPYPKEVESLMGLKTIAVACGVWHMTAIVEVNTQSNSISSPGKLFTWGDGDKYRLGHGDKEPRLKPTCVPSLIDHNFQKLACGHSLTVGLTTSGQVFTMGSTVYGQLGNPFADGKFPSLVEDKLSNESVEEITCGSYHVAVLTAKNDVYTWGKGGNGRLGHGDIEDRKTPTFVEALKDRHVRYQMALSLPSIPSISVARRSYRLSTATILNSQISIPPFKSPRGISFISRHQCAVVDASSRVFVPQTAVVDRNSVSLAEFKSEEELWAAVRLRIRTFYEFNQSSVGVEDHKTGLTNREFEALKERVSGKSRGFRRVSCLNATLPLSTAGVSVSPTGNLCSACKFWQNGEEQVVIGTLDINQCLKMVDELTGKRPEGIGSDITRAYLSNVCVAKELQRNGVAYSLITKAIAVARSWGMTDLYVHVAVDNGGARKLYDKCGFVYEDEEKTWQARHLGRPDGIFCGEI